MIYVNENGITDDVGSATGVILTVDEYNEAQAEYDSWQAKAEEAGYEQQEAEDRFAVSAARLAEAKETAEGLRSEESRRESDLEFLDDELNHQKRLNHALMLCDNNDTKGEES